MNARNALLGIALAFGVWETSDVPHTGAPAAVFAVLFLTAAVWLWRRRSFAAAVLIAVLCSLEASQAHTWNGVGPIAKLVAEVLGTAGIVAAAAFVAARIRMRRRVA
jgi:hypothetical protein